MAWTRTPPPSPSSLHTAVPWTAGAAVKTRRCFSKLHKHSITTKRGWHLRLKVLSSSIDCRRDETPHQENVSYPRNPINFDTKRLPKPEPSLASNSDTRLIKGNDTAFEGSIIYPETTFLKRNHLPDMILSKVCLNR